MSPQRPTRLTLSRRYFGKYRGIVVGNVDPLAIGRIQAQVPDVLGEAASGWALPSVPFAGIQAGVYIVPPVGSAVWIEFEQGDPDLPIWTGGFWANAGDVPTLALTPPPGPGQTVVIETSGGSAIALSDAPDGGITLKSAGGAMIVVSDLGVTISNGKGATITLVGPTVSVNSGGLEVVGPAVTVDGAPLKPGP